MGFGVFTTAAGALTAKPAAHSASAAGHGISVSTRATMATLARLAAALPGDRAAARGRGAITGTVLGAHGKPLADACVTAHGPAGTFHGITHSNGRFLIPGVMSGHYTLQYSACAEPGRYFHAGYAKQVGVSPGHATTLATVSLVPTNPMERYTPASSLSAAARRSGGRISGFVKNRSGRRLQGICVIASFTHGFVGIGVVIPTGPEGKYSLPGLPRGRYTVQFQTGCGNHANYAPQWWNHVSRQSAATKIRITPGRVVRHVNATLHPGAEITGKVRLRNRFGRGLGGICVEVDGHGAASGTFGFVGTRPDGSYLVDGLATGRYKLYFYPGCHNNGNYLFSSVHHLVRATAGKVTRGVNGYLHPAGKITGQVTDSGGRPLRGICVFTQTYNNFSFAVTSRTGSYALTQLTTGHYAVAFGGGCGNSGSYASQLYRDKKLTLSANLVPVVAGQTTTGINAVLKPGATISGTVTGASGQPLGGVCVGVTTRPATEQFGSGLYLDIEQTNRHGDYEAANLDPGQYVMQFFPGCGLNRNDAAQWFRSQPGFGKASAVSAPAGTPVTGIGGTMLPAGSISGTVTSAATGRPVSDICVTATGAGNGAANGSLSFRGRYRIENLPPGSYKVEFSPCGFGQDFTDQWYRGKFTQGRADLVKVTAGRVSTGISAAMRKGGSITGRVFSGVTHLPRGNACVFAFNPVTGSYGFTSTGRHGRYRMVGLDSGSYLLIFSLCQQGTSSLAAMSPRRLIQISAPHSVSGVNAVLPQGGGIAGTVTAGRSSHAPAPGVCVETIPLGAGVGAGGYTFRGGSYVLRGMLAGSYDVFFSADTCLLESSGVADTWFDGQLSAEKATPVKVTAGDLKTGIDVTMPREGQITGTVTAQGGAPLGGICVTAVPVAPAPDLFGAVPGPVVAVTAADGTYSVIDATPGRYRVRFDSGCGSAGKYATQWYDGASSKSGATVINVPVEKTTGGIDAAMAPAG
jgi:Carboxypeptidase regulatory-like domain